MSRFIFLTDSYYYELIISCLCLIASLGWICGKTHYIGNAYKILLTALPLYIIACEKWTDGGRNVQVWKKYNR